MTFGTHSTRGTGVRSSPWKPTAEKSLHAAPAVTSRVYVGMGRWPARWRAVRMPATGDSGASPTRLQIFRPASGTIALLLPLQRHFAARHPRNHRVNEVERSPRIKPALRFLRCRRPSTVLIQIRCMIVPQNAHQL